MLNFFRGMGLFLPAASFIPSPGSRAPDFHHSPLMGAIAQALQEGPVFRTLAQKPPVQKEVGAYLKFEGGFRAQPLFYGSDTLFLCRALSIFVGMNLDKVCAGYSGWFAIPTMRIIHPPSPLFISLPT